MEDFSLAKLTDIRSRSLSAENVGGEKGKGGMDRQGVASANAAELGQGWKISPYVMIEPGQTKELADIEGPGAVRHMWMTDSAKVNRALVIRIYWDHAETPSVETPLCDFFASADYMEYRQLSSSMVCVNPRRGFNCYWDMPFYRHCRITIENIHFEPVTLYYQIDYQLRELPKGLGYFHAQFRRTNPVPYGEVCHLLDTVHGKGQYVGTYLFWGPKNNGWWGEGEIKFYMDGDRDFPTICGTGTEDYFCASYDFEVNGEYREFCTPYTGLSKVIRPDGTYHSQMYFNMYRWHVTDPIYFERDLRVTIQALGWRKPSAQTAPKKRYLPLQDDISSVVFFYLDHVCTEMPAFPAANELEIN